MKWVLDILISGFLAFSGFAYAHPGGRDAQGCHVCKTNCEKYGVKPGVRHCHGPDGKIYYPGDPENKPRYEFPTNVTVEGAQTAYVEKVSDGDTIKVRLLPSGEKLTVRIQGIDCPESHVNAKCKRAPKEGRHDCAWQVPRGLKASKRAAELMKRKTVYLECGGKCTKGKYGRALRYVRLEDGTDYSLLMIKEGLCEDYGWKYPHHRGEEYKKANEEAKRKKIGIWKD